MSENQLTALNLSLQMLTQVVCAYPTSPNPQQLSSFFDRWKNDVIAYGRGLKDSAADANARRLLKPLGEIEIKYNALVQTATELRDFKPDAQGRTNAGPFILQTALLNQVDGLVTALNEFMGEVNAIRLGL